MYPFLMAGRAKPLLFEFGIDHRLERKVVGVIEIRPAAPPSPARGCIARRSFSVRTNRWVGGLRQRASFGGTPRPSSGLRTGGPPMPAPEAP